MGNKLSCFVYNEKGREEVEEKYVWNKRGGRESGNGDREIKYLLVNLLLHP